MYHQPLLLCSWAVSVLIALTISGQCDGGWSENAESPCSISGSIRWIDERELQEAEVRLHRRDVNRNRWQPAEQTVSVDADGRFCFSDLPSGLYWCVAVRANDAGTTFRQMVVDSGQTVPLNFTLHPAANAYVSVLDDQGQSLAGAMFRRLELADHADGTFTIERGSEQALGLSVAVSDADGRLVLPDFSEGTMLKSAWIDHPAFSAAIVSTDTGLISGAAAVVELKRGIPLQLDVLSANSEAAPKDLYSVTVRLFHNQLTNANTVLGIPFPLDQGQLTLHVEPGEYRILDIDSEPYFLLPRIRQNFPQGIHIATGKHDHLTFRALPKVLVSGRVVTNDGQPVVKAGLIGELENLLSNGTPVPQAWGSWTSTEWAETDTKGEYHIHLAPGRGRIRYEGPGIPSINVLPMTIDGSTEQTAPDIVVRHLPTIRGIVHSPDGQPAEGAIVRIHSNSSIIYMGQFVFSDSEGRFEFTVPGVPGNPTTGEPVYEHTVYAFTPHQAVGGTASFDLRSEETAGNLTISMTEKPIDWPLSAMREGFNPWEQGQASARPERELTDLNRIGAAPPEFDTQVWLNTNKRSLEELRGQLVLLDFYTTWCGPCTADFPTVKAVHDLYGGRGITVIGVHDNSTPYDQIRDHAEKKDMQLPIAIDHPDGRLLKAWEAAGLVFGYPSYVLIGPDGRLIAADMSIPGPTLRNYKIELVRQIRLERAAVKSDR